MKQNDNTSSANTSTDRPGEEMTYCWSHIQNTHGACITATETPRAKGTRGAGADRRAALESPSSPCGTMTAALQNYQGNFSPAQSLQNWLQFAFHFYFLVHTFLAWAGLTLFPPITHGNSILCASLPVWAWPLWRQFLQAEKGLSHSHSGHAGQVVYRGSSKSWLKGEGKCGPSFQQPRGSRGPTVTDQLLGRIPKILKPQKNRNPCWGYTNTSNSTMPISFKPLFVQIILKKY